MVDAPAAGLMLAGDFPFSSEFSFREAAVLPLMPRGRHSPVGGRFLNVVVFVIYVAIPAIDKIGVNGYPSVGWKKNRGARAAGASTGKILYNARPLSAAG